MDKDIIQNETIAYDYIIIGSGPAGCVLGKTLSDNKKNSVLLLEAGENDDDDWPIKDSSYPVFELYPQYFWQGETAPQEALNNRTFKWTTGRVLGGGSSVNGMLYVRSTLQSLNQWESLLGQEWSSDKITNNYNELEKYNGLITEPNVHGYNGRINIRQTPAEETNMSQKLVRAIEQASGFKTILDYNDPYTPIGPFTRWQLYQKPNGLRESASSAFLSREIDQKGKGVNGRKLKVQTKSTALRIIFDDKVAIGVEYLKEGKFQYAIATKKIIISAGVNSTQLLILSGIGPGKTLRKHGIPVIYNNPNVGENLVNHTLNFATFTVNPDDISELTKDPYSLYVGGAFLPSPLLNINQEIRRVQLIGNYSNDNLVLMIKDLQPKSRGYITIQNNDPLKTVFVDEKILDNPYDLEVTKAIFKYYIKPIAKKLSKIDSSYKLISPTYEIIDNDQMLEDYILSNMEHNQNQQSSLRMAPIDVGGVVDNHGRVYGVENLIVADCSIIPYTTDGNTAAPSFIIGYTIAKQLLEEEKNQNKHASPFHK